MPHGAGDDPGGVGLAGRQRGLEGLERHLADDRRQTLHHDHADLSSLDDADHVERAQHTGPRNP